MIKIMSFLIISLSAFATPRAYMFCLGQEEAKIHKERLANPTKLINEKIISYSLQLSEGVILNKNFLKSVCESKSPSTEILKSLLKNQNIFLNNISIKDKHLYYLAQADINDLKEKSIYLFLDYLTLLKNMNPDIKCFKKYFPKIDKLLNESIHRIEETEPKDLIKNLGDIDSIFNKIQKYPSGQKKC